MKKLFLLCLAVFLCACSSMIPYKNQNLDYLHGIEKDPAAYRGKVVSFGGKVKGITEDTRRLRLIIKIDVPFYYYATGKDPLSYELLLISFDKKDMPQMTGIQKGSNVKVLARVANFETRKNLTGKPIAVLHLIAFALADRDRDRDFFRPEPPHKQLYESWKSGRLFFNEQPQEIEERNPAPERKTFSFFSFLTHSKPEEQPTTDKGIVYDEEEPTFILQPDSKPAPQPKPAQAEPTVNMTPEAALPPSELQPQKDTAVVPTTAQTSEETPLQEPIQPQLQTDAVPTTQTVMPPVEPLMATEEPPSADTSNQLKTDTSLNK